jgi:hypothetical protein
VTALLKALPWLVVVIAALVFVWAYPAHDPSAKDAPSEFRYELVKVLLAMVIGGFIVWFGSAVVQGMEEGLKSRQQPGAK